METGRHRARSFAWPLLIRGVLTIVALLAAAALAPAASAAPPAGSPAYSNGHPYRHGVVPLRGQENPSSHAGGNAGSTGTNPNNLSFGGGISGVGVTTGTPKVYLVFWGPSWQTTGDPSHVAPYLESFLEGIGTGNETWSGVMTQYCQGPGVAPGSQSCPAGSANVGYPTGGALSASNIWFDTGSTPPSQATANQIAAEAMRAADTHFHDYSSNSQYVVVSPHGTHPDGFNTFFSNFCAWHDYTGDSTMDGGGAVTSSAGGGPIAFTNLPYIPDAGASCGQDFVNAGSAGALDGVSIVEGHEYAETLTDTFPAGGWTDSSGYETGDKCAWISSGQGASTDITLNNKIFAVQSTWANDFNGGAGGCEISHPIITNGAPVNTVTVTTPVSQTSTTGTAITPLQVQATDSDTSQTLTFTATGLPGGLTISSSGLISGTPTTPGTSSVTVTATDTTGASGSATFSWTVNSPPPPPCSAAQLLGNPGFETGTASPWTTTSTNGHSLLVNSPTAANSGSWYASLNGLGFSNTDTLAQTISLPSNCTNYSFSFYLHITTAETSTKAYDKLKVQVLNSSGSVLATLATFSNANHTTGYVQKSYSLASYAGQTVTLKFTGTENSSRQTTFAIDDTAVNVS